MFESEKNRVLVVAAHPDDEVLGCGGTIARHVQHGDQVRILIMSEGITSRNKNLSDSQSDELSKLHKAAKKASKILGVEDLHLAQMPDNRMDRVGLLEIVKVVENHLSIFCPTIVYTHYPNDLNIDHELTSRAVITAARPLPDSSVKSIFYFEVPSSSEWNFSGEKIFTPNVFISIETSREKKIEALKVYQSEMRKFPHSRSLQAVLSLAEWRGASSGVMAAESFILARGRY